MNQNQAGSGMRNLGMVGGASSGGANAVRESTLAERLERANNILFGQMDRVQNFIGRVNGTPPQPTQDTPGKIAATAPLYQSVEATEQLGKRLAEMADSLERIG
jgi:hypothetical protein